MTETLTLRDGRFLEPDTGEVTEGDMRVEDGVIVEVGAPVVASGADLGLRGATVVPGLIDAHLHAYAHAIGGMALETRKLSYVAINATKRLGDSLRRGFTTVRDVAGGDLGLKQAIDAGIVNGPRYLFTGEALSQTGGHADVREAGYDTCFSHGHIGEIVDGVDAVRRTARERFRTGAHCLKIMASGGVVSPTDPLRILQYSPEEIRAAVEEASRRRSYVAAHAYTGEAVIHAVSNGVLSVEHGNLIDEAAAEVMAQHGAYLVPTLAAYDAMNRRGAEVGLSETGQAKNAEVLEAGRGAVELAMQAGVRVGWGSDLMGDLEDDQLRGIALQAEAQKPADLLRSLTTVNAELIGQPDLATLAAGTVADLVAFSADPMDDPEVLWDESRPRTVVKAGRLIS